MYACSIDYSRPPPGTSDDRLAAAGVAESALAPRGCRQLARLDQLRARDRRDHELRDPFAALERHALLPEVGEDHANLASKVFVDRAGAVQAGHAFTQSEARSRP